MTLRSAHRARLALVISAVAMSVLGAFSASASAMKEGPGWELTERTYPTNIQPGGKGTIGINVFNIGAGASQGAITVTDVLPSGMTATDAGEAEGTWGSGIATEIGHERWYCTGNGHGERQIVEATIVTCTNLFPSFAGGGGGPNYSKGEAGDQPNPQPIVAIAVDVGPGVKEGSEVNHVTIAGGGASTPTSIAEPVTIGSKPAGFGFADWSVWSSNADGTLDTQAGSHPYETVFSFDLNAVKDPHGEDLLNAGGEPRNIAVNLPPGLVGNPNAVPQCTRQRFLIEKCPNASQVGVVEIQFAGFDDIKLGLYNLVPPPGEPAELAFTLQNINTFLDTGVRSGSDYGITTHVNNAPARSFIEVITTIWNVPGDPSHDLWRSVGKSGGCTREEVNRAENGCFSTGGPVRGEKVEGTFQKPFLTLPTSCAGPQSFSIHASTWQEPIAEAGTSIQTLDSNGDPVGFTGCEHLDFGPTITTSPDTSNADTPAGLTVTVKPSVGDLADPEGLGTSDIENTTVTLPEGMTINPGQAAGLQACQETEVTLKESDLAPACPSASKVGTDEIETPLLKKPLQGNVYLLQANPPDLQLLLQASGEGVNLKLIGHVHLTGTGQLVTTFSGTPPLPFTSLKLSFSGGAQAALSTPTGCGTYTTNADFSPWSSPFVADFLTESNFQINKGTNNAPCPPSPLPFTPSLIAGSTTDQAGGFTNFSLLLQAPDDQQRIERLQFKVPQGLLGMISRVPLCPEPQAQDGTCSSVSQIGHTVVASGPGPYPLVVPQPGQPPAAIYLTGPYKDAPYGLSIVVPVVAGPFTLQTQIVRAKIEVDPLTAQITVTTDPFPQVIDGIRTDLRTINAVIDRPGFMFNPTNCNPMSFSGTAFSAQGTSTPIGSPFQMGSCRSLLFKPDFKVSTSGKTSRRNGASLDAKIVYPTGALGANQASSQSNLKSVKVDLPKQLPSRLTTLQKACTSATFEANPANCPADSRVGTASAVTPVLPVTLTGPAYFVSYGGAKFPELVFALQGYGVTIYVHGETFINKAGITSSTFHQVPDVPIYQFELKLPQGPFSALAANGNLCNTSLKMPTAFTAQDGAVIKQSTPISVTGCPKKKSKGKKTSARKKTNKTKKK
jgi:uncharacterized repeat protein (TIGR01451 family)